MDQSVDARDARDAHDAPHSRRGLASGGTALLCVANRRAALAAMLVLQEIDLGVDVAPDLDTALRWARQARYDLIVAGGNGIAAALAARLRHAAPHGRLVILAGEADVWEPLDAFARLDVELLPPPQDVNLLMRCLLGAP